MRDETTHITIHLIKYADEADRSIWFGMAAANNEWPEKQARLVRMPWARSMDSWGANEWAWFCALLWHQASDVLPPVLSASANTDFPEYVAKMGSRLNLGTENCCFSVLSCYKFRPEDPKTFAVDMEREFRAIAALPRFADDTKSSLHTVGAGGGLSFTSLEVDSDGDVARVFDTSWHWKRAGELLGVELEDRSQAPGVTYRIGGENAVLDPDGRTWFETERAYIEHRCGSVMSTLPEQERRDIANMVLDLASANGKASKLDKNQSITMLDYVLLHQKSHKKQPVPAAMRKAYKKYGIAIPEMEQEGAVHRCANCDLLAAPKQKFKSCPCTIVRYCSAKCQKKHWKAHHRYVCPKRDATGAEKQTKPLKFDPENPEHAAMSGAELGKQMVEGLEANLLNTMSADSLRMLSAFKDANPRGEGEGERLMSYAGEVAEFALRGGGRPSPS